ncbi:MAG: hypothetical protein JO182_14145 [Acidobacteriaceae bacterium]|nr:hypothetical protein [Acidobacteriaceae bacterium]
MRSFSPDPYSNPIESAKTQTKNAEKYLVSLSSILRDTEREDDYWEILQPRLKEIKKPELAKDQECAPYKDKPKYTEFPREQTPSFAQEPKYVEVLFSEPEPR